MHSAERREMGTAGDLWEPVEETFAVFFPNNIVGLVRSTTSAPSHAALARWLNRFIRPAGYGSNAWWFAQPIIDEDRYLQIRQMDEVSTATFAVRPENIEGLDGMVPALFNGAFGYDSGIRMEVKLTAARGRAGSEDRGRMLELAQEAAVLHGEGVPMERATVRARREAGGLIEEINLLEHRLTKSVDIPIRADGGGRSLSQEIIVGEIHTAFGELEESLQAAIGHQ